MIVRTINRQTDEVVHSRFGSIWDEEEREAKLGSTTAGADDWGKLEDEEDEGSELDDGDEEEADTPDLDEDETDEEEQEQDKPPPCFLAAVRWASQYCPDFAVPTSPVYRRDL